MKFKYLYLVLIPIFTAVLFFAAFKPSADNSPKDNSKLIKFSHKLHADVTDCESCHIAVPNSTSLNDKLLPTHESCGTCHDVEDEKNCNMCHYDDNYEPLIKKKSELIFNHSFHISKQKLECEKCHIGFKDVEYSSELANPNPSMETCFSCHGSTKTASSACESCHISTANLIPQSHKSGTFLKAHKFAARGMNANCMMCHDNNSCEECHDASSVIIEKNTKDNFYQPYSPSNFKTGVKQQQITRVHELGYRFTHGIDAKGKTADCQSCHDLENFCASCHTGKDADYSLGGIEPYSHLQSNFMMIGVGSGGGEHATLARRDIESCAACHDTQGADPTCIKCHLDSDGIKGTNPRTHPANFMKDTHGDWHDNSGSVCYNCHTSANPQTPSGFGFCGYCHGAKGGR